MIAEFADQHHNYLEKPVYLYDPNKLEVTRIEDILLYTISTIKKDIAKTMGYLQGFSDMDNDMINIVGIINAIELIQMHLEFTLAVLNSTSEDEVKKIKEKFKLVNHKYQNVKTKEDLSQVPAKYVVAMMHNKIILEFRKIISNCFQKNSHGEVDFIKSEENRGRIKIVTGRFEVVYSHFSEIITFPKDDIFCFEKSSPVWQDLHKAVTFKEILTEQEIEESSRRFIFFLYWSHLVIKNKIHIKNLPYTKAIKSFFQDVVYYGIQQSKAETQALLYLLDADVQEVFKAWHLAEHPLVSKIYLMYTPAVAYDEIIFVPRLFPPINDELVKKEYAEKTFNKICPMDLTQLRNLSPPTNRNEILQELFVERENKVQVRILSNEKLKLKESSFEIFNELIQKAQQVIKGGKPNSIDQNLDEQTIVIHIHGGGFVATSSLTHRVYLNKWTRSLNLIHFAIDYRLSPKSKYPDALDDVWQAYLWILNYSESVLGIKKKKVILAGDSAGGNLSLALMYRLIRAGLEPPHGCLLLYPAVYIDSNRFSPSYFRCLDDPMLAYSLLKLIVKAYVPEGFLNKEDPCISPLMASDEILEKLPPIRIVVGSKDPFYDDIWRFLAKLRHLNKDVRLVELAHLSHGFLCQYELKNHDLVSEEACELMRELIALNP